MKLGKMLYAIDNDIYEDLLLQEKKEIAKKNASIYINKEYKQLLKWLKKEIKKEYVPYLSIYEIESIINSDNIETIINKLSFPNTITNINKKNETAYENNIKLKKKVFDLVILKTIFKDNIFDGYIEAEKILKSINPEYKMCNYIDIIETFQNKKTENINLYEHINKNKQIRK